LLQFWGASHVPDELQSWVAEFPAHCVAPAVHVPWQDAGPPSATQVEPLHATAVPQLPLLSQVCTPWLEHCVVPGMHCPMHMPPTHAEFVQATAVPQFPLMSQVSTPFPKHRVAPGAHMPVQAPPTQAWLEHATALAH
jgi:hypothetical protein